MAAGHDLTAQKGGASTQGAWQEQGKQWQFQSPAESEPSSGHLALATCFKL